MIQFNRHRVKAERVARNITVSEMADKLSMHPATYSKKENGKLRITVEDLSLILNVLDMSEAECGIFFTRQVDKMETLEEVN